MEFSFDSRLAEVHQKAPGKALYIDWLKRQT